KPVGLIDKYPDDIQSSLRGQPVRLWWARQAQCRAQQGTGTGQFVGTSEVTIPCSWQVHINLFAGLLIKNDGTVTTYAPTENEAASTSFKYPKDGDPIAFIQKPIASKPSISTDYFSVVNTFTVTKVPRTLIEKRDQETAVRDLQMGRTKGSIWTSPNSNMSMQDYFDKYQIQLFCSEHEEFLGRIPAPRPDPHIVEVKEGNKKDVVQAIAKNDTPLH